MENTGFCFQDMVMTVSQRVKYDLRFSGEVKYSPI